ncbi:phospholipase C [Phyllobacterium sp. YR620]|uniref:alkaline phosphatase family protein n=1 Tax=Phyllobacterium sp. YR620 TaxID=1881066 RepID=UPI0008814989|nr:alkaline phosphatase family protein [Phyllobacterium sp. YR620]SDP70721.1 phospholipase C [Phyllobacterium sp. YR620]
MDRRDFIKMLGLAGTSAAAYAACSSYMMEALADAPATIEDLLVASNDCINNGSLNDIEHVVFLMQENRSFDHYFGTLRGVRGFGDPRPLRMRDGRPVWEQLQAGFDPTKEPPAPDAQRIKPYRMPNVAANKPSDDTSPEGTVGGVFITDPDHGYGTGVGAWNYGRMDNWIPKKQIVTMAHYVEADIPLYFKLAKAFTLCDAYFCSVHGYTDPNRSYFYTGHSNGKIGNDSFSGSKDGARPNWKSYPERLEEIGVDWKFYQDGLTWTSDPFAGNYGDNTLEYFQQYRDNTTPIYKKNQTVNSILRTDPNKPSQFEQDIIDDKLPAVSWIAAPEAFCEHPKWSPHLGEYYVHEILRAFTANVEVWKKTVFIITYDENGGFFDHVPAPTPPFSSTYGEASPGIKVTGLITATSTPQRDIDSEAAVTSNSKLMNMMGMGVRVPTLVISPWSVGGRVCSEVFDHTSAIQFVDAWLMAKGKKLKDDFYPISSWRRAIAGDFTSALDFKRKVLTKPEAVADTTKLGVVFTAAQQSNARKTPGLNPDLTVYKSDPDIAKPTLLKQDRTRCEIMPLDYDFFVGATVTANDVKYPITNRGKLAASFYVIPYDRPGTWPGDGPWYFSVEGSKGTPVTVKDQAYANFGAKNATTKNYSYAVHGPNGYLFEFMGAPGANPTELQLADITDAVSIDEAKTIRFTLKWPGVNGRLKVTNAYTGNIVLVEAGTTTVDIPTSDGWYDVSFVDAVNAPSRYLRRYAGHLENGKIGKSDPAIGLQYDEKERVYKPLVA